MLEAGRMKTDKEQKQIETNIKAYSEEGLFKKGDYQFLVDFYLDAAKKSLSSADALMQLSENTELKRRFNLLEAFETYLWVCVISYYSMFYAVNALFSKNGIKIGDKIAHKVTSDVFYYYFIRNNKIAKELFKIYEEAKEQAMDMINTKYQGQAEDLARSLEHEMAKRGRFQYNFSII